MVEDQTKRLSYPLGKEKGFRPALDTENEGAEFAVGVRKWFTETEKVAGYGTKRNDAPLNKEKVPGIKAEH